MASVLSNSSVTTAFKFHNLRLVLSDSWCKLLLGCDPDIILIRRSQHDNAWFSKIVALHVFNCEPGALLAALPILKASCFLPKYQTLPSTSWVKVVEGAFDQVAAGIKGFVVNNDGKLTQALSTGAY